MILEISDSLSHCFGSVLGQYQESVVSTLLTLGIYRATKRRKPAFFTSSTGPEGGVSTWPYLSNVLLPLSRATRCSTVEKYFTLKTILCTSLWFKMLLQAWRNDLAVKRGLEFISQHPHWVVHCNSSSRGFDVHFDISGHQHTHAHTHMRTHTCVHTHNQTKTLKCYFLSCTTNNWTFYHF